MKRSRGHEVLGMAARDKDGMLRRACCVERSVKYSKVYGGKRFMRTYMYCTKLERDEALSDESNFG